MAGPDPEKRHLIRCLTAIHKVNRLIVHKKEPAELIKSVCDVLLYDGGFTASWIYLFPDLTGSFEFSEKNTGEMSPELFKSIKDNILPPCAKEACKSAEIISANQDSVLCSGCPLFDFCGKKPVISTPITCNEKIYGVIYVSYPAGSPYAKDFRKLTGEISDDLGFFFSSKKTEIEKEKAYAAISEDEKKYRMLFDSANDMVYLHETGKDGLPGKILEANIKACKKMGYTKEEFKNLPVSDLNDPQYKGDIRAVSKKLAEEDDIIFEWSHLTKKGEKIPVEISVHHFEMDDKNLALSVVRDISERKKLENELLLTLNATTEGIWKWNFKTDEMEMSPRYYTMLGFSPYEFPQTYESWVSLIHPKDRKKALETAEKYLKTKADHYENEFRMRTKDGGYRCIHASANVVERDKEGSAIRIIGNHRDITGYKKYENRLKISDFSVEKSPMSTFWIKPDGSFFYVNEAACKELGYTKDELLKMGIEDVDPDYPREKREIRWAEIKQKKTTKIESRHITKDGRIYPVEVINYYLKYGNNEFEIANSLDITERKNAENTILEKETKYKELFNSVSEAVFLHKIINGTKRGRFIEVNDTACRRLGYTKEELLGMKVSDINTPDIRADDAKRVLDMKKTGTIEFEAEHVRKDRTKFPVFVKAKMIDIGGEKYILSLVRDISREKEIKKHQAETLTQIEKNIIQLSVLNDKIRNPLAVISGYMSLEESDLSDLILAQVKEIDDIINQLDMGWIESQKIRDFLKRHYNVEIND